MKPLAMVSMMKPSAIVSAHQTASIFLQEIVLSSDTNMPCKLNFSSCSTFNRCFHLPIHLLIVVYV